MSTMCAYMPSEVLNFSSFYGGERGGYSLPSSGHSQAGPCCWPAEAPAAKRRCTDKSRMWPPLVADMSGCPSDCVMCQDRRPLQERHANGVSRTRPSTQGSPAHQRQLSVDPKKDYSSPLFVDCSVEYDLPRVVKPPPGAQPLLIKANDVWWDNSRRIHSTTQNHSFKNQQQQQQHQVQNQPMRNLERIPMPVVAATAPNLIPRTGPCNCPSCLGRYWSPPVGATASSIAVSVGYPPMVQGMTYVDQSSAGRRRKRTLDEVVKMNRSYLPPPLPLPPQQQQQQQHHQQQSSSSTSSAWVPGIDFSVFNNRLVTPAPWMALKFTC